VFADQMATNGAYGLASSLELIQGLKVFQPELIALVQRVGKEEGALEEKERQLQLERVKLGEKEKSIEETKALEYQKLRTERDQHDYRMKWERESFEKEKRDFQEAQSRGAEVYAQQEPITVEVGGEKYRTTLHNLAQCQGSIFPSLVKPLDQRGDKGRRDPYIFIDRDGRHFRFILNYLRQGERVMRGCVMKNADLSTLNEILDEVSYYKIASLENLLKLKVVSLKEKVQFEYIAKVYFQQERGSNPAKYKSTKNIEIRECNLTGITFNRVDFCHPVSFENCVMRMAKFVECRFGSAVVFSNVDMFKAAFIRCDNFDIDTFTFIATKKSEVEVSRQ
jgi:hypothetical protein